MVKPFKLNKDMEETFQNILEILVVLHTTSYQDVKYIHHTIPQNIIKARKASLKVKNGYVQNPNQEVIIITSSPQGRKWMPIIPCQDIIF